MNVLCSLHSVKIWLTSYNFEYNHSSFLLISLRNMGDINRILWREVKLWIHHMFVMWGIIPSVTVHYIRNDSKLGKRWSISYYILLLCTSPELYIVHIFKYKSTIHKEPKLIQMQFLSGETLVDGIICFPIILLFFYLTKDHRGYKHWLSHFFPYLH